MRLGVPMCVCVCSMYVCVFHMRIECALAYLFVYVCVYICMLDVCMYICMYEAHHDDDLKRV
jgi:hypothetical protein